MEKTSSSAPAGFSDRLVRLIPSGLTLLAVIGLLVAARFYDVLPVKPAPCGLRTLTGVPCLGCGGTRAMMALSQGDFVGALSFNPAVIVGVLAVIVWFSVALWGTITNSARRSGKRLQTRWIVTGVVILAAANWIYLYLNLPD